MILYKGVRYQTMSLVRQTREREIRQERKRDQTDRQEKEISQTDMRKRSDRQTSRLESQTDGQADKRERSDRQKRESIQTKESVIRQTSERYQKYKRERDQTDKK